MTRNSHFSKASRLHGALVGDARSKSPTCTPTKIAALTGVRQIALGDSSLALKEDGPVWGWGENRAGELCDGSTTPRPQPAAIAGITSATSVVMGSNAIFVLADGTVRMCGKNESGALADTSKAAAHRGKTQFLLTPVPGYKVKLE